MNVRRFTARTSRDALILIRQVLGSDAVVLSTKPCAEGVEVLAMAPEGLRQVERMAADVPAVSADAAPEVTDALPSWARSDAKAAARREARPEPAAAARRPADERSTRAEMAATAADVEQDVSQLTMSTLSFQDFVRERMLRRRQAAMASEAAASAAQSASAARARIGSPERHSVLEQRMNEPGPAPGAPIPRDTVVAAPVATRRPVEPDFSAPSTAPRPRVDLAIPEAARPVAPPMSARDIDFAPAPAPVAAAQPVQAPSVSQATARRDQEVMMNELRQVKGLIEERFGALAFMEKLSRQPAQARLAQRLLSCGFSPALIRKIGDSLPMDINDEAAWAAGVLERNLLTAEAEPALEDQGGVYALVGATGVGKTTTTAKIAAAFAAKHGASHLGLITLDAYRVGAHEQLRTYGRILGVPVHTAHDRASLEDLLDLLSAKKMVLIDTAGMAQRDARTRELLDMLGHQAIRRLLVINAAAQGETIEDVMVAYHASVCAGIVLSKMDEAVKLGGALDALIRHKLKVVGVANGQRVPEDWHRLSANALVHRALRGGGGSAYQLDDNDVSLIFTAPSASGRAGSAAARGAMRV